MVHVIEMVQKLSNEMEKLIYDNRDRDRAMSDLTVLVKRNLDLPSGHIPQPDASRSDPFIPQDLMDSDGNLRATDIGITWAGLDTFLHRVKVVGPAASTPHQPTGPRPATSTPYQPAT